MMAADAETSTWCFGEVALRSVDVRHCPYVVGFADVPVFRLSVLGPHDVSEVHAWMLWFRGR